MQPIRVFFKKEGSIRYISHLDLARAVTRVLLRTGLPIYYTEGFNPHPKLVFAVPLSIYQESEYEIFDFAVEESFSLTEIKKRLIAAFPPSIIIFDVAVPVEKLKSLATALYRITLDTSLSEDEVRQKLSADITVTKKTKTKIAIVDIAPQITQKRVYSLDGKIVIEAVMSARNDNYLNPQYIVDYFGNAVSDSRIKRLCLYTESGKILK